MSAAIAGVRSARIPNTLRRIRWQVCERIMEVSVLHDCKTRSYRLERNPAAGGGNVAACSEIITEDSTRERYSTEHVSRYEDRVDPIRPEYTGNK